MLDPWEISCFYINSALKVPSIWNLSRKHLRVRTSDGKFVKLNKFENRINVRELRDYCIHFSPVHVYFSVLDWLFPERVGKKYKANYAVPVCMHGGFYEVNWTHSSLQNMERLHHLHQVSGVYTRMTWVRNGDGGGKVTVFTHPPTILIVNE